MLIMRIFSLRLWKI